MRTWHVYLVRCADQTLYCGITTDLARRLAAHNDGSGARYTRSRLPVELVQSVEVQGKSAALRLEMAVKKRPRREKTAFLTAHDASVVE